MNDFKKKVHSFRMPLPPSGQKLMGLVYFTVPIIIGYFVMQYTNQVSEQNNKISSNNEKNSCNMTTAQNNAFRSMLLKLKAGKDA